MSTNRRWYVAAINRVDDHIDTHPGPSPTAPRQRLQCENHPALELYEPDFTVDPDTGAFSCLLCMPVRPR
jgi:hypothetical protein